jgi:hypothetical protein
MLKRSLLLTSKILTHKFDFFIGHDLFLVIHVVKMTKRTVYLIEWT